MNAIKSEMVRLDRYPTVAEVVASYAPPLAESYWWATGWTLNRPVVARIGVGAHIREGAYVWIQMGDHCPIGGYKVADLERVGIIMSFVGPIPFSADLILPNTEASNTGLSQRPE